jgi:cell division protein FtsW
MRGRTAYILILSVVSLLAIGIVMLQSTGAFARDSHGDMYHFVRRQAFWLCIGLAVMVGASLTDYRWWGKFWPYLYGLAAVLLVLCFVPPIGMRINGSWRWINLGFASFQPSELAKVAALVFLAWWYHRHENETKSFLRGFVMPLGAVALLIGLIAMEVDLGASA